MGQQPAAQADGERGPALRENAPESAHISSDGQEHKPRGEGKKVDKLPIVFFFFLLLLLLRLRESPDDLPGTGAGLPPFARAPIEGGGGKESQRSGRSGWCRIIQMKCKHSGSSRVPNGSIKVDKKALHKKEK